MTATPVSLYLDLEPGQVADMEVVARASLAFAAAVRALAAEIDPFLEIRIELASGTEGSLSLNSILRNLRNHKGEAITLGAIALIVLSWFGNHLLDYGFDKAMELIDGKEEQGQQFTPEQRQELKAIVDGAVERGVAIGHAESVYREIERDPAIKGVGATSIAGQRPAVVIPRSQFAERSGARITNMQTAERRTKVEYIRVGLISPVLLQSNRRWKFRSSQGEFGAPVKDENFIRSVVLGTTSVRMRAGIEMDIELETLEDFKNGVWEISERNVTKVIALHEPVDQGTLGLFGDDDHKPHDDDD